MTNVEKINTIRYAETLIPKCLVDSKYIVTISPTVACPHALTVIVHTCDTCRVMGSSSPVVTLMGASFKTTCTTHLLKNRQIQEFGVRKK